MAWCGIKNIEFKTSVGNAVGFLMKKYISENLFASFI